MPSDMYMYVPKDAAILISSLRLKLVDPEKHLFIHGSRRLGYHNPDSETDVTIYMNTNVKCELPEILNLLQDCLDITGIRKYMTSGATFTLRTIQEEYLDDFLPNDDGIAYFHLPLHKVHIRVYCNLDLFTKEKEELDYIEQNITDKEIWSILDNRKKGEYYDGKEAIDMLKSIYQTKAIARFKDWGGLLSGFFNRKDKICTK